VGIGGEQMHETVPGQVEHRGGRRAVGDQSRGDLDQGTSRDQRLKSLLEVDGRVPLGVRDDRPEPTVAQVLDRPKQEVADGPGPRLYQDPAVASAERDGA
jgi:hypothetical protein